MVKQEISKELVALMIFPFDPEWDRQLLLTEIAKALKPHLTPLGREVGVRLRTAGKRWESEHLWYLKIRKDLAWQERVIFDKYFAFLYYSYKREYEREKANRKRAQEGASDVQVSE